jgi:hypothetical protein
MNYVDSTGVTIFALLADGSLLLRPLAAPPAGTKAGLQLCNVSGTLNSFDLAGKNDRRAKEAAKLGTWIEFDFQRIPLRDPARVRRQHFRDPSPLTRSGVHGSIRGRSSAPFRRRAPSASRLD